jgi:DNA polymerase
MQHVIAFDGAFDQWRDAARRLAAAHVPPDDILWQPATDGNASLFPASAPSTLPAPTSTLRVPADFLPLAQKVAHHRDPRRFEILYRTLYRLTHGNSHLLEIAVDDDIYALTMMEKAVRRDAHKMKAFVRFREVATDAGLYFVAYHKPEHRVLRLVTDFFADRFHDMPWTILTPDESATWNGSALTFHPGTLDALHAPAREALAAGDDMEAFWKTYYSSIFNPARLRLRAMAKEMPKKFWHTLPEAEVIDPLTRAARRRVDIMIGDTQAPVRSAADYLPDDARQGRTVPLAQLREAATACRGCDLCHRATHTVFGEGPPNARLMLLGEQPGDEEDLAGRPFIGPAGRLLMSVLDEVGLPRDELYITNAVKHFKWTPGGEGRGKRRIHAKPTWTEVTACRPWLLAELAALQPQMIVTLGATAARALLGPDFRLTPNLGRVIITSTHAPAVVPLLHPSALLRIPDPALHHQQLGQFTASFRQVAALYHGRTPLPT